MDKTNAAQAETPSKPLKLVKLKVKPTVGALGGASPKIVPVIKPKQIQANPHADSKTPSKNALNEKCKKNSDAE